MPSLKMHFDYLLFCFICACLFLYACASRWRCLWSLPCAVIGALMYGKQ